MVRPGESPCRSQSSPTAGPIDGSPNCGSTTACGPVMGRYVHRPPLLQGDPELRTSDVVGEYQRALAVGDVDAIVAAFEPDGYAREPTGGEYIHRGRDDLRAYGLLFSNGGGTRWNTAPQSTTGAYAYLSTTWCAGARRSCRRRPESPSTFVVRAAGSRRHLRRHRPPA
jgi:hypothetical protein